MQNIASQILSEAPSANQETVKPTSDQSENTQAPKQEMNDFDSRFSILTKMERKLKEQESNYKSQSKEREERDVKFKEYEEFMALMDENPLEALKKRKGWGVQEFNEFAVKHSTDEDLDPVSRITKSYEARMAELEERLNKTTEEKIKAKEDELQAKEYEGQIREFKSGIKNFLLENKNDFEFINADEDGHDTVYDLIYEDIMRQKAANIPEDKLRIMDTKDAAEKVEAYLDKQYSKYLGLNKVKSKFNSSESDVLSGFIKKSDPETLNSSFSPKSQPAGQLSEQERRQKAIDFIKSQKT